MRSRLGAGAGQPYEVADRFKDLFEEGLGIVTLRFIDLQEIPVFGGEVIPHLR